MPALTLTADSVTNVNVGNINTDIGILIKFTCRRIEINNIGKIFIPSPYLNFVEEDPFISFVEDEVGLTITCDYSGSNIRLILTVDNSSTDPVLFDYNITEVITKTKVLSLPLISSIVVTTADPTLVRITYDAALNESLVPDPSAYTVEHHTVNSVAVSGSVVTLTLAEKMIQLEDKIICTYTVPGSNPISSLVGNLLGASFSQFITNNIADSLTKLWVDGNDETKKIISDVTYIQNLSVWQSKDVDAHNLIVSGAVISWGSNAIFMGAGSMYQSFSINYPIFVYMVAYKRVWYIGGVRYSGRNSFTLVGGYGGATTPDANFNAGSWIGPHDEPIDGSHIFRDYWNGANSKFIVDAGIALTGNPGNTVPGGFTLAAGYTNSSGYMTGFVKEVIIRNSDADEDLIYNYLYNKWFQPHHRFAIIGDSAVGEYGTYGATHQAAAPGIKGIYSYFDAALSGYTIAQNKAYWLAHALGNEEVVFILTGHNDINPSGANRTAAATIASLQDLVNTVRATIGPLNKIVLCTMCPIRAGYGEQGYAKWLVVNAAIMDGSITGADMVSDYPSSVWRDANGYLKSLYAYSDNLHMLNNGVKVFADWAKIQLTAYGL